MGAQNGNVSRQIFGQISESNMLISGVGTPKEQVPHTFYAGVGEAHRATIRGTNLAVFNQVNQHSQESKPYISGGPGFFSPEFALVA